ncbi:MAG TPA: hypothetical protein VK683_03725, partial [Rhizomicrobium sp.]|nr:hypothetical protein [Rhizomicrobium sp.]
RSLDSFDFRAQLGKIGGKNRRRNKNRLGHSVKCRILRPAAMLGGASARQAKRSRRPCDQK